MTVITIPDNALVATARCVEIDFSQNNMRIVFEVDEHVMVCGGDYWLIPIPAAQDYSIAMQAGLDAVATMPPQDNEPGQGQS